jgi:valyl-tRNA synthetase
MNRDFVEKAPEEVVEKERARRAELSARMAKLKEGLAILKDVGTGGGAR